MSAGTGVVHSEFNASRTEPVHFLQIWIMPAVRGVPPRYEDRSFDANGRENRWQVIVSPDGADGSLDIHQHARNAAGVIRQGRSLEQPLAPGRDAWLQVARGSVTLQGAALAEGDGAAVTGDPTLVISATSDAEVLLFDLA